MAYVATTDGVTVHGLIHDKAGNVVGSEMTMEQAESSAAERNSRAAEMGLKVRYEAVAKHPDQVAA